MARMRSGDVFDAKKRAIREDSAYQAHQKIYYYRRLPKENAIPFQEQILFQDAHIVVVDKPHFLPVTPAGRYLKETLLVRLKQKLGIDTLSPIHRIDRETAGLVLFSTQPGTRGHYQSLFQQRDVQKEYEAIAPFSADIALPCRYKNRLVESPHFMQMQATEGTNNAETAIALLDRKGEWARYHLNPITGRKHQLRAHMASLGVPIKNDLIYPVLHPEAPIDAPQDYTQPLQLLAKSLSFVDPINGKSRQFKTQYHLEL